MNSLERHSVIEGIDEEDKEGVSIWTAEQRFLQKVPSDLRYKVFLIRQISPFLAKAAANFAHHFHIAEENAFPYKSFSNPEAAIEFFDGAPSIDTRIKLMFDRLKNPNQPIKLHDNRDISFLSTAVPYCDIVITEKTWKHSANSQNLTKKYKTVVESDLNYLLSC